MVNMSREIGVTNELGVILFKSKANYSLPGIVV